VDKGEKSGELDSKHRLCIDTGRILQNPYARSLLSALRASIAFVATLSIFSLKSEKINARPQPHSVESKHRLCGYTITFLQHTLA